MTDIETQPGDIGHDGARSSDELTATDTDNESFMEQTVHAKPYRRRSWLSSLAIHPLRWHLLLSIAFICAVGALVLGLGVGREDRGAGANAIAAAHERERWPDGEPPRFDDARAKPQKQGANDGTRPQPASVTPGARDGPPSTKPRAQPTVGEQRLGQPGQNTSGHASDSDGIDDRSIVAKGAAAAGPDEAAARPTSDRKPPGRATPAPAKVEAERAKPAPARTVKRPPPTPAPPRPKSNPVEKVGRLLLESTPNADVYFQGKRIGRTPLQESRWPTGRSKVELRNDDLGIRKVVEINVRPSAANKRTVVFKKGRVSFLVQPWAHIAVNGTKVGTTPLAPVPLFEGRHKIVLDNPQMHKRKVIYVNVIAGKTAKVVESMQ